MKKFLLFVVFATVLGYSNQAKAQCAGAIVLITNVQFTQSPTHYIYSFNWSYVSGNASIQVRFRCGGVYTGLEGPCLPFLKDSTAGSHAVKDSFLISAAPCPSPALREIVIGVWTSSNCNGQFCPSTQNIILPVSFKSFTATRNQSNVGVKWETAFEQNNSGFVVERNIRGTWEQAGFVPSQAANGNSTTDLSYQFSDLNNTKGITQYRIKQVDIDGQSKYSEIRSVRGDGQKGKTIIYPNPSTDGKVNVVFEETNVVRDISVTDMAGRTVKQMKGVTNNNITIENLTPGMYTLRVLVPATGDQTVEKIIVNKR